MNAQSARTTGDRILLSKAGRSKAVMPPSQWRSQLWTIAGGVVGSTILLWVMVQLGQASNHPKDKLSSPAIPTKPAAAQADLPVVTADREEPEFDDSSRLLAPPTQGPALDVPREVIEMLNLRKRDLDRREEALRQNEERLVMVRTEVEKLLAKNEELLAKNEVVEKQIQAAQAKAKEQPSDAKAKQPQTKLEKERLAQEQKNQLAKIYEAMPSEDAAARLERLPERNAVEILRLVKTKSAGAILSQVKPDYAAKLSAQLLVQQP
jgi:flagellar motility protein MotE (MotC chaperone)